LEIDQALIDLKTIRTQVEEAAMLHEECLKLLALAFSKLTKIQVDEEVFLFQKTQAELHRGLAIQTLALALSSDSAELLRAKLKAIPDDITHTMTYLLAGAKPLETINDDQQKP
jgi:hypothetical protein